MFHFSLKDGSGVSKPWSQWFTTSMWWGYPPERYRCWLKALTAVKKIPRVHTPITIIGSNRYGGIYRYEGMQKCHIWSRSADIPRRRLQLIAGKNKASAHPLVPENPNSKGFLSPISHNSLCSLYQLRNGFIDLKTVSHHHKKERGSIPSFLSASKCYFPAINPA